MASIVACFFLKRTTTHKGWACISRIKKPKGKGRKGKAARSKAQGAGRTVSKSAKVRSKAGTGAGAGASRKGRLNYNANKASCDKRIEYISLSWNSVLLLLLVVRPGAGAQPPARSGTLLAPGRSPISRPAPTWPHGARQRTRRYMTQRRASAPHDDNARSGRHNAQ